MPQANSLRSSSEKLDVSKQIFHQGQIQKNLTSAKQVVSITATANYEKKGFRGQARKRKEVALQQNFDLKKAN